MNKADAAEALIERQLQSAYSSALQKIMKQNKSFLKLMKDVSEGKIQPPQFYIDNGLEERWKQGFLQQALRQQQIIQQIAGQLDKTGERAGKTIKDGLSSAYFGQYKQTTHDISTQAQKAGIHVSFGSIDKRAVKVAVNDVENAPFSKIAYNNLGNNTRIRRQLQNEMAQAIMLGESQTKVIKRIRDVVGNAQYNAKRTAQTEGTRIRSQARERAQQEAAEQGVRIVNEWSTNMDGKARDQHEAMNGKMVKQGDPFIMPNGDEMLFPADPNGSAENVINCRCVLIPHVLAKDEDLVDGRIVKVAERSALWDFAQEENNRLTENNLEPQLNNNQGNDIIHYEPNIQIFRSLSAKALNYDVLNLETGERYYFVQGTQIQYVQSFAGKGSSVPYYNAYKYADKHGGKVKDWQHMKGFGYLDVEGEKQYAEIHWSQCHGIGKFDFFIKRWLDESQIEELHTD